MARLASMISVRLTPEEVALLDEARGGMTRSSWLRRAVLARVKKPTAGYDPVMNIGYSTGGTQYTKYKTCLHKVGQIGCQREQWHEGPHEGQGYRWVQ